MAGCERFLGRARGRYARRIACPGTGACPNQEHGHDERAQIAPASPHAEMAGDLGRARSQAMGTAEARHQLFTSDSVIRSGEPEPSAFTASQSGYETSMSSRNAILLPSEDQIGPPQSTMQQSP